jgi:hypothetical protein
MEPYEIQREFPVKYKKAFLYNDSSDLNSKDRIWLNAWLIAITNHYDLKEIRCKRVLESYYSHQKNQQVAIFIFTGVKH